MNEPFERWEEHAPEQFRAAKKAYAQLGPDAAQLERMLARVEQAAALPMPASRLGFGARAWRWLLPVLSLVGATLWVVASRPELAPVERLPAPIERSAAASSPGKTTVLAPPSLAATPLVGAGSAPKSAHAAASAAVATGRQHTARPSDPVAELALLDRARRVLAKDPQRALALAAEHQRHYAAGQFAQERELLAIQALMRLDRADAAQRRARQFRHAYPNSVHAHRLGVILSAEAR